MPIICGPPDRFLVDLPWRLHSPWRCFRSFQRLHVGANSPTGPGAGAGAGALAYLASHSQSSSLHGSTAAAAGGAMASTGEHAARSEGQPAKEAPAVPWWTRYTRWRQTSRQEGKDAEYKVMRLFPG